MIKSNTNHIGFEDTNTTWELRRSWRRYVASKATAAKPVWNEDMVPGSTYTDKKTSIATTVPGSSLYVSKNRDPYADFVTL